MPLSKPWPGIERNVIALACVAITLRPIVPQPADALPRRYVLRLRTWRVRQEPYAAMPTMVPSSTTDRKSTRLNSSHGYISYAVLCLKKKLTEGALDADRSDAAARVEEARHPHDRIELGQRQGRRSAVQVTFTCLDLVLQRLRHVVHI